VEPPFDRIDITGNSRYYELSFRQPLVLTPTKEFALGVTTSRQESATKLLGEEFPLSAGADDNGKTRISTLRFFQEWTQRNPQEIFAVRSQFSLGLGVFDATINNDPPDSRFFSWRGQAQYVRLLAPETLLLVRSDAQLATRALVPLEQFGLGGLRSVRGYRQDVLLTDNAVFTSAEVRLPIYRARKLGGVLQLAPFIDFGIGWNSSGGTVPGNNTLVSFGLGLQWQMGNRLTARFDYGIPLIDINSGEKRTLQEQGLYFSLNYSPF
ncbi:MAG TPA: ShlB/FhaC/HecB family hemolysin secretion/activation protein, partial [Oculatellaceae cyanobacterium]